MTLSRWKKSLGSGMRVALAAAALATASLTTLAQAAWPERPVTMIVPFAAGGTTDVVGRLLADHLAKKFKQSFVVENRPGAGGNVGLTAGKRAPNDGYTLVVVSVSTQAINPFLYKNPGYDAIADFDPIGLIVETPNVLVVNPKVAADNLEKLVALIKAKPGEMTFGSAGIGTSQHLAGELLLVKTGTKATHVPFRGSGEIMQNLIGGHIDWSFDNLPATAGAIDAGQVRAIAISSLERNPSYPNLPTIAETFPGFSAGSWLGLVAPKGIPADVIATLNNEIKAFLEDPAVSKRLGELRAIPAWRSPTGYTEYVMQERAQWEAVVKASGAKVE